MKQLSFLLVFLCFYCATPSFAQNPTTDEHGLSWYTDISKAQEVSNKTHKPIFAFFTGSDWCGWCHRLQANVFAKQEFIKWAQQKVILLELDFPRNKQLSPELMKQNNDLQQVFHVQGYPTVWIFNLTKDPATSKMNISAFGSLGYPSEGKQGQEQIQFLKEANQILANKKG